MRSLKHNRFLRHNVIFFLGTGAIGALNYAYYPLMGRLLNLTQFGEVQALFSILTEVSILFAALGLVIVHITVNSDRSEADQLLLEVEKAGVLTLAGLALVWVLSTSFISHFLKLTDGTAVLLFYGTLVLSYFASTRQAALQGSEAFGGVTRSGVLGAAVKLGASLGFVALGYGITGAVCGLIVGQLAMLAYALLLSRRQGFTVSLRLGARVDWRRLRPEIRYVIPVFIVSVGMTLLSTSDILVVKHYFSPILAGQYAGVAAIGRIIIFLTASISGVLFTKVKPNLPGGVNRRTLWHSLLLVLALGGVSCAVMVSAPQQLVGLLLGDRYTAQAANLPWLAVTLLLLAILNLVAYYDLALRRKRAALIIASGLGAAVVSIVLWHANVRSIIFDLLYTTISMLVIRGSMSLRSTINQ